METSRTSGIAATAHPTALTHETAKTTPPAVKARTKTAARGRIKVPSYITPSPHRPRVVHLGTNKIVTHGLARVLWADAYHYAMVLSWPSFFTLIAVAFLAANATFAGIFLLGDHAIANQSPEGFWGAFFFSVETLATVGYGDMHPQTVFGHWVATTEIFIGMSNIALITGLMFARFSRPRALIMFAQSPVITLFDAKPTFMVRAANARQNVILEASAHLRMLKDEVSPEGIRFRRLYEMKLSRDQQPMFLLGWSLMHVIDEESPLWNQTAESIEQLDAVFILTISGMDETTSQTMQARVSYPFQAVRWGHQYDDILSTDDDGVAHLDYAKFNATHPFPPTAPEQNS